MNLIEQLTYDLQMSGLKPETQQSYILKVIVFLRETQGVDNQLTLDNVQAFLRTLYLERHYCVGTVNYYRSALKYFFEVTLEQPWSDKKIPRLHGYNPLPHVFSKSDVLSFIEATPNPMYRAIFYTLYGSGLRVGEVATLRVKDVDSKRMQLYIPEGKNGHARFAILSKTTLCELRNYVRLWRKQYGYVFAPDDWLFPSSRTTNNPISKKTIKNNLLKQSNRLGLKKHVTAHTLRHCFATHLLESGVDLLYIKELLGHRCLHSTSIYLHLAALSELGVQSPLDHR